jgi:ComF family protein
MRPALDLLLAVWWYERPLSDVLRRLKFGRLDALAFPLVDAAISREVCAPLEASDLVAPVPLALWRQWSRGFNQAESLARPLAARLGRPLFDGLVRRSPVSARQARLGRARRLRILEGGFRVGQRARDRVAGKSVLLVDDIVTTGATLAAAASVLRRAGAREVLAFAVAATPRKGARAPAELA